MSTALLHNSVRANANNNGGSGRKRSGTVVTFRTLSEELDPATLGVLRRIAQ